LPTRPGPRSSSPVRGISEMSPLASPPTTTLRGHWLLFARMAWVTVAITALAIIVFSVPSSFEHYSSVCTAASEVCSEQAVDQPTPEGARALRDAGLSAHLCASERCGGQGLSACVVCGGSAHPLAAFRRPYGAAGLDVSGVLRAGHGRYHGCRSLDLLSASLVVARPGCGCRG
jgi:hypothetical protein